jgi:hypothetical protein
VRQFFVASHGTFAMRLVVALFVTFVSLPRLGADDLPTPKQIFDAWGTAADQFQSVKIVWTEKVHHTAYVGSETKNLNDALRIRVLGQGRKLADPGVPKEHTHENQYMLWLAKGKWRVEMTGKNFSTLERRAEKHDFVNTYDGNIAGSFHSFDGTARQGVVSKDVNFLHMWTSLPWTVQCQLFDRKLTKPEVGLANLKIDGTLRLNGQVLVRATNATVESKVEEAYHFSPDLSFSATWFEQKVNGVITSRYVADFDPLVAIPTFPKRATTESFEDGMLTKSAERTLVSLKVNEPLPAKTFTLDFPPGTEVNDITVKPNKKYIVPAKPAKP